LSRKFVEALPVYCPYCTRTALFSYQTNYQCTVRTAPEQRCSHTKPITSVLSVLLQNSAVLIPHQLPVYCPYCTRTAHFSYQTITSVLSVLHQNTVFLIPNQLPVFCPYCTGTAQFSYQTNYQCTVRTAPEQRSSHTKPITSVLSVLHQNSAFSYQTNYQCTVRTEPEQRSSHTKPIIILT
jgi:hypothetical protein